MSDGAANTKQTKNERMRQRTTKTKPRLELRLGGRREERAVVIRTMFLLDTIPNKKWRN